MAEWLRRGLQIHCPAPVFATVRTIRLLFRALAFKGLVASVLTPRKGSKREPMRRQRRLSPKGESPVRRMRPAHRRLPLIPTGDVYEDSRTADFAYSAASRDSRPRWGQTGRGHCWTARHRNCRRSPRSPLQSPSYRRVRVCFGAVNRLSRLRRLAASRLSPTGFNPGSGALE
jgi:hypothetical protein